jgi:hypothetical protein
LLPRGILRREWATRSRWQRVKSPLGANWETRAARRAKAIANDSITAKLSDDEVRQIRALLRTSLTVRVLAQLMGVWPELIWNIKAGKTYMSPPMQN